MEKRMMPSVEVLQNGIEKVIDFVISQDSVTIKKYVDKLRLQNPGISNYRLAKKIVSRKSMKNGLPGAVTSLSGIIPVSIPADLVLSWRTQAVMAYSVAYVYGHTQDTTDLRMDIFLIIVGDAAKEPLKKFGVEVSKSVTKKAVDKYITREIMVKIWKVIPQKIITKAGKQSLLSFMKMVPVVGAPVGFLFDWTAAQIVGKAAIHYYSG